MMSPAVLLSLSLPLVLSSPAQQNSSLAGRVRRSSDSQPCVHGDNWCEHPVDYPDTFIKQVTTLMVRGEMTVCGAGPQQNSPAVVSAPAELSAPATPPSQSPSQSPAAPPAAGDVTPRLSPAGDVCQAPGGSQHGPRVEVHRQRAVRGGHGVPAGGEGRQV